jgi:hypothetical protein
MKVEIEIDDDVLDQAFKNSLKWHMNNSRDRLNKLSTKKNLSENAQSEYDYQKKLLPALKIVGEYYGVK